MKQINLIEILALLFLVSFSCGQKQKDSGTQETASLRENKNVYEWRGVNRSGIYNEKGLLKVWPEDGPEIVWEYEGIGNGYCSPIFTSDNMYILGEIDTIAYLFAFDSNGKLLWKKDFGNEWVGSYRGSRSSPTVVDDLIYATSGLGNLVCFNRRSGEKKWSINMIHDLGGILPVFGYSESVVFDDEKVFCTPGGKEDNVVALNRFTGEVIWRSAGASERHAYNSPQIIRLHDRDVLVNFTAYELMGHDTETGELLWIHNQNKLAERIEGNDEAHCNTIYYEDGFIYYTATGAGNGGVKLDLAEDGKSVKEVWRNKDFDGFMGGFVKIGDHLYGCGTAKRGFKSVNATTGEIEKVLKIGNGAVIAADGMLYYYNQKGQVMLITLDPQNMKVVSEFKILKGNDAHFTHPVINNGKLYIRHGNVIQAFNIKEHK
jgi:outer membrane protein assembly factor BamB